MLGIGPGGIEPLQGPQIGKKHLHIFFLRRIYGGLRGSSGEKLEKVKAPKKLHLYFFLCYMLVPPGI